MCRQIPPSDLERPQNRACELLSAPHPEQRTQPPAPIAAAATPVADMPAAWQWTVLALALLATHAGALQFYLKVGERRCFTEAARPATKVLGEYTVTTGHGTMPVDILVRSSTTGSVWWQKMNIDHGKFAFVVPVNIVTAASVHGAEMRRQFNDHVKAEAAAAAAAELAKRRKLLSVEGKHEETYRHHAEHPDDPDYEDDDWDLEDYEGIDDEEVERERRLQLEARDALHDHGKHAPDEDEDDADVFDEHYFEICVSSNAKKAGTVTGQKRRVRLSINRGAMAHDFTRLAKKEHMSMLEVSLSVISSELHELLSDLDHARQMEEVLRKINEKTNHRVVTYASVSLFLCAAVGAYQAFYTKRLFHSKKLL